jgi:trans-2,3-dihydro-3-hydroxyanthranilate isomerase
MKPNKSYHYKVVDVFTKEPLKGNPLAVFPDAVGLGTELMQEITRELNLSETVFLFPSSRPECVARLRIFTPGAEMDFAGHPTIGTAYVLVDEGKVSKATERFIVEENVGPIPISVDPGPCPRLWFMAPPAREETLVDKAFAATLLGLESSQVLDLPPQIMNAGYSTLFIPVADRETVDRISFETAAWTQFKRDHPDPMCVFAFAPTPEGAYSRNFAPDFGIREDPATGGSTVALAGYMLKHRLVSSRAGTTFHSEQGTKMGRRGILHLLIHGEGGSDGIAVGGNVAPVIEGTITL